MFKKLLFSSVMLSAFAANATFVPVTLTGFNQDIIANGIGNANLSTTAPVDLANWDLVSLNFQATAVSAFPTNGLPTNGTINSVNTAGLPFQLANYTGNNGLVLAAVNATGTLTFSTNYSGDVYVLGFTGNGPTTATIDVKFTDNTVQTFAGITFDDWYGGTGFAIKSIGRIERTTNVLDAQGNLDNPRLYEKKLTLSNANYAKQISAITVTKTNATGVLDIVAVTVCTVPAIGTQPVNRIICKGYNTGFNTSSPNATAFRWQVDAGSGFTDLSDNAIYGGTGTPNLTLTGVPAPYNSYQYRCRLTSACGAAYTTAAATLTVIPDVAVTASSSNVSACSRAAFSLNITNSGTATSYQWQINTPNTGGFVDIAPLYPFTGTQTNTLNVDHAHDSLATAVFRCQVGGSCNNTVSADIPVNIVSSPFIYQQPINDTIVPYQDAVFATIIMGNNYIMYWQSSANGVDFVTVNDNSLYTGSKASVFAVHSAQPSLHNMKFRCVMKSTNPVCSELRDTTEVATLVMQFPDNVNNMEKTTFAVYPNPVNGNVFFITRGNIVSPDAKLSVTDVLGRVVYSSTLNTQTTEVPVTLPSNISPGMYILKLTAGDITESLRILKQ